MPGRLSAKTGRLSDDPPLLSRRFDNFRAQNHGGFVLSSFNESHAAAEVRPQPVSSQPVSSRGFTLVELMVTIAVAAVLLVIAVPNFRTITINNRLRTAADDVYSAVNTARMEAIKRNASTQFCGNLAAANGSDPLGAKCDTNAAAVAATAGGSATLVRAPMSALVAPLQLKNDMTPLRFDSNGIAHAIGSTASYSGVIADICTSAINHRIVRVDAGSIVSVSPSSNGTCP